MGSVGFLFQDMRTFSLMLYLLMGGCIITIISFAMAVGEMIRPGKRRSGLNLLLLSVLPVLIYFIGIFIAAEFTYIDSNEYLEWAILGFFALCVFAGPIGWAVYLTRSALKVSQDKSI